MNCRETARTVDAPRKRSAWISPKRRAVMQAMERAGFSIVRSRGDHFVYSHDRLGGCVPVSKHLPTIPNGTYRSIWRLVKAITGRGLEL